MSLPYVENILPADSQTGRITCFWRARTIPRAPQSPGSSEYPRTSGCMRRSRGTGLVSMASVRGPAIGGRPPAGLAALAPAHVSTEAMARPATDDWPFLYLRNALIPWLNVREMILLALVSAAILLAYAPTRRVRPNGHMFFLGAGFMLLETKGVVHVALLFGSTWIVNSVVFFAILLLILAANLYVRATGPVRAVALLYLLVASLVCEHCGADGARFWRCPAGKR